MTDLIFFDEATTINESDLEAIADRFREGSKINLNGFGHASDGPYAVLQSTKADPDGSFTVSLERLDPSDIIKPLRKDKHIKMKEKLLITVAVVAAVAAAGYASVHHHDQVVLQQRQAEAVAEQKAIAAQKAAEAAKAKAAAELAAQQAAQAAKAKTSTVRTVQTVR